MLTGMTPAQRTARRFAPRIREGRESWSVFGLYPFLGMASYRDVTQPATAIRAQTFKCLYIISWRQCHTVEWGDGQRCGGVGRPHEQSYCFATFTSAFWDFVPVTMEAWLLTVPVHYKMRPRINFKMHSL